MKHAKSQAHIRVCYIYMEEARLAQLVQGLYHGLE
jgi:hypothetical protein